MKMWVLLFTFLIGIGIGLGAPSVAPRYLKPYFPKGITAARSGVQGIVVKKQLEENRLLLTISAPDGALLATFQKKIPEITLLVDEGDAVTLDVRGYAPFVTDPPILRVKKPNGFSSTLVEPDLNDSSAEISPTVPQADSIPDKADSTRDDSEEPMVEPEESITESEPPL